MKQVCIIGAGASGLPAIKCCVDEGIDPVCYERSHDIGGLWRYEDNEKEGASVYKSIVINTCKELMCYSDFPIPKEFANYMHNSKIIEYMRMYAKQFNLLKHINFHTEVLNCEPADDYEETGKWKVTTKQRKTGDIKSEIFDGVLVCIGHHAIPHFPTDSFRGFEKFQGKVLHSHSYKQPFEFQDKKVVVIGIGNSGGDISVELGKHAEKVFLSTRRGAWVINRVGGNGIPGDIPFNSRAAHIVLKFMPERLANYLVTSKLNERFDHAKYGLKPKHKFFSQHPMVNDALPNSILSGLVVVKANVAEFTETGVIFEDGTKEDVDVVIFATGYVFNFPFFDESVLKVRNNECRLYRYIFPPHLKHGNMAVIGNIQPLGAVNPISEIQCRWATRLIKGNCKLPPGPVMERCIDENLAEMHKKYYRSQRHTIQVDYVSYMDEIADEIGVKPDVLKILREDFKLGLKVLFGPTSPYQYRLVGHGSWPEARQAIMTVDERIHYPLSTRKTDAEEQSWRMTLLVALLVVVLAYLMF